QVGAGAALAAGGGGAAYGALVGRHDYVLEELTVAIPGLPRQLDGFTIAQISDIHLGLFVGDDELAVAEELVRKARADLAVLTGDLVDHDRRHIPQVGMLTRKLAQACKYGVAAVPGNHDYYTGVDQVLDALRAAGADVLLNRSRRIGDGAGGFALVGVDDV